MSDLRPHWCWFCGGDGGWEGERRHMDGSGDWVECTACGGDKVIEIELKPLDEYDLEIEHYLLYDCPEIITETVTLEDFDRLPVWGVRPWYER